MSSKFNKISLDFLCILYKKEDRTFSKGPVFCLVSGGAKPRDRLQHAHPKCVFQSALIFCKFKQLFCRHMKNL